MDDEMLDCTPSLNWLTAFLAGAVAGAGVTLLLTPDSGRNIRGRARRKLEDAAEDARQLEESLARRGQALIDEAHHRVEAAATALRADEVKAPG